MNRPTAFRTSAINGLTALVLWVVCAMTGRAAIFTGGPGASYAMATMTGDVSLGGPVVTLASATNLTLLRGTAPVNASTLTIAEGDTPGIKSGTPMVIRIPLDLALRWDTNVTSVTRGGSAAYQAGAISYAEEGKALVIAITDDFAPNDTLTIDGAAFVDYLIAGTGRLQLDFNNNGVSDALDPMTLTIVSTFHIGGPGASSAMDAMNVDQGLRISRGTMFMFR